MSNRSYSSVATVQTRMIVFSLVTSTIIGGCTIALGAAPFVLAIIITAGLLCSLLCARLLRRLISEILSGQIRAMAQLMPEQELLSSFAQPDDIKALFSACDLAIYTLEARQKERKELLEQVFAAQEKIKLTMHNRSTGDEKETAQLRDAVASVERLNSSFMQSIYEIEVLSGRAEESASISAEMSSTTDTIAENINQYSSFVIETSSSIEEMARATRETAGNIRALSASTEQTASSINTISSSQIAVRDNSEQSASVSKSVRTQAQHGLRSMAATMKAMQEIAKSTEESFDSINRLSGHSARVGEFLNVIREIVEQTNLLSLNASIIAAQAGARGRAFTVVAEEVRSLARRTSVSTKEIEELVRNIQKETASVQRSVTQCKDKVKEGVKISGMANEALLVIDKSSEDAFKMVSNIAAETTEQAVSIQNITEEAERNHERVQQITVATEQQQQVNLQIVTNLEHMRELGHRINSAAQEQVKGNRLYLESVVEDSERIRALKSESVLDIVLAKQAVESVRGVETKIIANTLENLMLMETLTSLTDLINCYCCDTVQELDEEPLSHDS